MKELFTEHDFMEHETLTAHMAAVIANRIMFDLFKEKENLWQMLHDKTALVLAQKRETLILWAMIHEWKESNEHKLYPAAVEYRREREKMEF